MKIDYAKLDARVAELKDELIADIQKWTSIESLQADPVDGKPFGENVAHMLDVALDTAKGYGFETRNIDYYCGDVSLGKGEQTLGILSHVDIVPAGEGWHHDPFGGEIADGKIFGRGTIDDKGPALCALHAMRAVRDCGIPLKDGVRLILGCDEETGMTDMRYYREHMQVPDYGFSPDASFPLINIEKGMVVAELRYHGAGEAGAKIPVYELYAGERCNVVPAAARAVVGTENVSFDELKAMLEKHAAKVDQKIFVKDLGGNRAEIATEGVLSHGSLPEFGVNAASILLIALNAIGAGAGVKPMLKMMTEKVGMEPDGKSLGIKCDDPLSHHLSCNLGILRYDGTDFCATLDIRFPICTSEEEVITKIQAAVAPYGAEAEEISGHEPLHVPAEHKVVKGLLKVYNELTNSDEKPLAIGGGTYSRTMPNTVAFGVVFPDQDDCCHIADEYIVIDRMMQAVRIFAHAIVELAGDVE